MKQAVRRNPDLFPPDFMFVLNETEIEIMVSQHVIPSKQYLGGAAPFAFTETGVTMLSGVLKSKRARETNIAIMRAFVALRRALFNHAELRMEVEMIKRKVENHDKNIELVFQYLDELIAKREQQSEGERTQPIGFKLGQIR